MLDTKQQQETFAERTLLATIGNAGAVDESVMQDNLSIFHASGATIPERISTSPLPAPLTSLIGREQAVETVSALVQRSDVRLVTLTGPGGVGKTQLGLAVAAALSETFADGVIFVSLAPIRDPAQVIPTIAQVIGLREAGGWSRLEHLQSYLYRKSLLLFLDNFEQVVDAAPLLVDLLQTCPQLHLLVTSRVVLHASGEYAFPIPPLALPDLAHLPKYEMLTQSAAIALFLERTQAIRPDFQLTPSNAPVIAEICIRLDGLPLAIELAAARVKLLSPHALLARLGQRLNLLTGGMRDAPFRQQTLRQTIQWSYDLLSAEEQQFFQQLSVFVGGCTLEAAEAVMQGVSNGTPVAQVDGVKVASSLIDQSLLEPTTLELYEPRLTMLETIREYGREMLAASGQMEETRRAHATYYLHLSEEAEPHLKGKLQVAWLRRLEQEHANLREALSWFLAEQETEQALRLCGALRRFWDLRGYWSEGRECFTAVFALPHANTPSVARARALRSAGELASRQDDIIAARQLFEASVALSQELQDTSELVASQGSLWLLEAQDGFLAGHPISKESVARCASLESRWERARLLEKLGQIAARQRDIALAIVLVSESLALARESGDWSLIAHALHRLARIARMQGDLVQSATLTQESLTFARELDDKAVIALSYDNFMIIALHEDNLPLAAIHCQTSLALAREMGDKSLIAVALNNGGNIALRQGDLMLAQMLTQESLTLARELGDQVLTAYTLHTLGDIALRQGDLKRATARFQEGLPLALAQKIGVASLIGWYLLGFARIAATEQQPQRATCLFGAVEAWLDTTRDMDPNGLTAYESEVATLRTQLGENSFLAAWNAGHTMTLEQIFAVQEDASILKLPAVAHSSITVKPSSPSSPDALTAREVEVLRLVTQGLTNPQVADQLIISPLTVNAHLRSIYSKLGVTSRAAATRYAIEHQLV